MMQLSIEHSARGAPATLAVLVLIYCFSIGEASEYAKSTAYGAGTPSPNADRAASHHMSCARAASLLDASQKLPMKISDDIYMSGMHTSIALYQVTVLAKVDPRGKLTSVSIEKSSGCALLDSSALRATAKMKWHGDKSYHANRIVWDVKDQ